MGLKALGLQFIQQIDKYYISLFEEQAELTILYFHKLFRSPDEVTQNNTMPHEGMTVADFDELINFFIQLGYKFVSPTQIEQQDFGGHKRNILLTFDDGYFNNTYAIPILEKYQIPCLFLISTAYTVDNQPYWWDILYREQVKRGKTIEQLLSQIEILKTQTRQQIYEYLEKEFGNEIFTLQDIDRPLTKDELKAFAAHPLVYIGNHTHEHYALAYWSKEEVHSQIKNAQLFLKQEIGIEPKWFAFPNGSLNAESISMFEELNISFLLTIDAKKNYLPLSTTENKPSLLGRICLRKAQVNLHYWKGYRSDRVPVLEKFTRQFI